MKKVTVILNGYKRPHTLEEQYEAIKAQTFWNLIDLKVWINVPRGSEMVFPDSVLNNVEFNISNGNYGTWGRFSYACNATTPYICIIDDDTIPGPKWIESCFATMAKVGGPCVLSTRGARMIVPHDRNYPAPESYEAIGWCSKNKEIEQVDMGCHSWFFPKNVLKAFWAYAPMVNPMNWGEDTHLSYAAWKVGVKTYVPPHPEDDLSIWGSDFDKALKYGEEACAISQNNFNNQGMREYWNFVRDQGYPIIGEKNE